MAESILPSAIAAEQCLLGSMMLDEQALLDGIATVTEADFYRPVHQTIFAALHDMALHQMPVDIVTLTEHLKSREQLDKAGGVEYLMQLMESTPTAANAQHYARVVLDKSMRRRLIAAATRIAGRARDEDSDAPLEFAIESVLEVADRGNGYIRTADSVVESVWEQIDCYQRGERDWAAPFGLRHLDTLLDGGVARGELCVIVADTSHGKTVMELMAVNQTASAGIPTLLFSGEMSAEQLIQRLVCMRVRLNARMLRHGRLDDNQWRQLAEEMSTVHNWPLTIMDVAPTLPEIEATSRRWALKHVRNGQGLIVIDYLQLIQCESRSSDSEVAAAARVVRSLKQIARRLNLPVITASQIRKPPVRARGYEPPDNGSMPRFPELADAFGTSETVKSPDKIIMLVNPPDRPVDREGKRPAWWRVAKNRNGETGMGMLWFFPGTTSFVDTDTLHDMEENDYDHSGRTAFPFATTATGAGRV